MANDNGTYPLNCTILGGDALHEQDDYIIWLKAPEMVGDIAAALSDGSANRLRDGYGRITEDDYGMPPSEDDLAFTMDNFTDLPAFYARASAAGHWVLFTVDQ